MPRPALLGLTSVVVVVVLVVGLAYLFQRRLIYLPSTSAPPDVANVIPDGRQVTYPTVDGLALAGWYAPGPGTTVLVLPGNAGDRSARIPLAVALRARGHGVLLVDYRGYGGNPGDPSEDGLAADAKAAHGFLVGQGVPQDRLVYFGESLGAAVAARLAREHPPRGLLLRSPFVDLPSVAAVHYPLLPARLLLRDRFPVAETVRGLGVPTTVVYGTDDEIVPPGQSAEVAAAANARTVIVEGARHNDRVLLDGRDLLDAVHAL
ncbi:alpha/beta hydrolase [Actinokineospora xionganensis]|uniref:alpha/beta hydrolase n=1 Tax=Actinokineospora xionganensis TaxID=2684470 RepID=UPI0028AB6EB4|nr:alpha/beta hydrolase [Actinokineospora xionganensis]